MKRRRRSSSNNISRRWPCVRFAALGVVCHRYDTIYCTRQWSPYPCATTKRRTEATTTMNKTGRSIIRMAVCVLPSASIPVNRRWLARLGWRWLPERLPTLASLTNALPEPVKLPSVPCVEFPPSLMSSMVSGMIHPTTTLASPLVMSSWRSKVRSPSTCQCPFLILELFTMLCRCIVRSLCIIRSPCLPRYRSGRVPFPWHAVGMAVGSSCS